MKRPRRRVLKDGTQRWCLNGRVHREGGPAEIEPSGAQIWQRHGKWHREDGPAYIGPEVCSVPAWEDWYIDGAKFGGRTRSSRAIYLGPSLTALGIKHKKVSDKKFQKLFQDAVNLWRVGLVHNS